jgi:hypothetical protein
LFVYADRIRALSIGLRRDQSLVDKWTDTVAEGPTIIAIEAMPGAMLF